MHSSVLKKFRVHFMGFLNPLSSIYSYMGVLALIVKFLGSIAADKE